MTREDILATVIQVLAAVAPEVDFTRVRTDRSLRDQVDIDSYDFLNVVVALHDRLGVDIPESDYDQLISLDSTADYLRARLSAEKPT